MPTFTVSHPPIRYLPANDHGRDFVIGDLHGCRAMLDKLLGEARFDPMADRLFSVGDLVDRGPDSMGCLALLGEPWFFAVRGNHESLLLDFVWDALHRELPLPRDEWHPFLWNGGEWILQEYHGGTVRLSRGLVEVLHRVRRLPFLWVVGAGTRRFNLVHADLFDAARPERVARDDDIDDLAERWRDMDVTRVHPGDFPARLQRWVWSRVLMGGQEGRAWPSEQPALSPTYCGHTIAPSIRRALSHVCLDTGAFIVATPGEHRGVDGHGLSMIDATGECVYFAGGPGLAGLRPRD